MILNTYIPSSFSSISPLSSDKNTWRQNHKLTPFTAQDNTLIYKNFGTWKYMGI